MLLGDERSSLDMSGLLCCLLGFSSQVCVKKQGLQHMVMHPGFVIQYQASRLSGDHMSVCPVTGDHEQVTWLASN